MLEERGLRVERQVSVAFDFNGMNFDEGGDESMRSLGNSSHAKTRRREGWRLVDEIIGEQLSREGAKARREGTRR